MRQDSGQEIRLRLAENRTSAAKSMLNAKMEEYISILSIGNPKARERARQEVIFAVEVLLDMQEEHMFEVLKMQGIDPWTRHFRYHGE